MKVFVILTAMVVVYALPPVFSQATSARAAIPRAADGKPDFTGVWAGPAFSHKGDGDTDSPSISRYDKTVYQDLFRPGGRELFYQKHTGDLVHDDPQALCLPVGFPRIVVSPYAQQWFQTPEAIVILYEYMHFFRVIPFGAPNRPHEPNIELTWMGDSIAWWEGDTLVIDTVGLKEWPLVANEPGLEDTILYHTDALHVVERIEYTDPIMASYQLTYDDPKIFTRPWTTNWAMKIHPTWKLLEFVCQENNRCEAGSCELSPEQQNQR